MTNLEITKLCAAAMGIRWHEGKDGKIHDHSPIGGFATYDPLHDDAHAMVLVKKFRLLIQPLPGAWAVTEHKHPPRWSEDTDLNRAICECVAKMQQAKQKEVA